MDKKPALCNYKYKKNGRVCQETLGQKTLDDCLHCNLLNDGFGLTRVQFWTYVFWFWLCMLPGPFYMWSVPMR